MKKTFLLIGTLAVASLLSSCSTEAETAETAQHETVTEETPSTEKMEEETANTELETIKLEQTHGAFTTESLELEAGKEYNFEVTNNAGRPAAFVLVKAEDASTQSISLNDVTAGTYNKIQFQFGISKANNLEDYLVSTVDNQSMFWPEQMEAEGVVSAPAHNGAREVLAPPPPSA